MKKNEKLSTSHSSLPTDNAEHCFFRASAEDFKKIPGSPIAYWVSAQVRNAFKCAPIGEVMTFKQGIATSDNERFLRNWHEIDISKANFSCKSPNDLRISKNKWFPYNKGGEVIENGTETTNMLLIGNMMDAK